MGIVAKSQKSLRKHSTPSDVLNIAKTLVFAHQFATDSSSLDLTNLIVPSGPEFNGFVNPSSTELAMARISSKKANIYLQYVSRPARLLPNISFIIPSDSTINLLNGCEALAGDVLYGFIQVVNSGAKVIDGFNITKSGILSAGQNTIVSPFPFNYNSHSGEQCGDVILFLAGQQLFRCQNNNISLDGEFIENPPSAGSLTNTLTLKTPVAVETSYLLISNGTLAFASSDALLNYWQTIAGTVDILVADMAAVSGNPTSRYAASPNTTDLSVFGAKVNALTSETFYNCVVGSATQVTASKATHSSLIAAESACPTGGKVLILDSYAGGENITFAKKIYVDGKGNSSTITGTTTLSANYCMIKNVRFGDNLSVSGNGNFVRDCWLASGKTLTNSGTANSTNVIEEA